jgi:hypothetical protein
MPEIRFWNYLLDGLEVTYKFNTQVLKSLDGEQRFRNRSKPRVVYKVSTNLSDSQLATAKTLLRDQLSDTADYRGKIYIPRPDYGLPASVVSAGTYPGDVIDDYWFDAATTSVYTDPFVTTNVTASGDLIGYTTDVAIDGAASGPADLYFDYSKLREHHKTLTTSFAFQYGETVESINGQVITLTYEPDHINFDGPTNPLAAYNGLSGLAYPYELCRIISPPEISRESYNNNKISFTVMSLEWEANYDPAASSLTLDGNGDALVDFLPTYKAGYSDSIILPEQIIDFNGPAYFELTELGLDNLSNRGFSYTTIDEYNLLQDFVECASGQFKKFYAYDDSTSSSREAFRFNADEITFSNTRVSGVGSVNIPFKKLESVNE